MNAPASKDYYVVANYYRERFNYEMGLIRDLDQTYEKEKSEAMRGQLRPGQTPQDLKLIYKRTHRAAGLRGDLAEAHRNAQTYALAVLVERGA